ncbi:MAG: hypothetical protein RL748_4014 [Pseudomonadota bacterium]
MATPNKQDFDQLVALALAQPGRAAMKPVVEKEILHYDIFHALDKDGLLKHLVFQGGTALRLCRGGSRFSEDLDFAGGRDFSLAQMKQIKQCIETHIGARYGLLVEVKEPKPSAGEQVQGDVKVARWQISVQTAPQQRDLPRQKIHIEIANIPAYTRELVPLRQNYDFLRAYGTVLVNTESLDEIMADKIIAYPASIKYVRLRDIWDLAWLTQQGAKLDTALVRLKIADYGIEGYADLLQGALERLPGIVTGKDFKDQMLRFIDADTISRTLAQAAFLDYLITTVGGFFAAMAADFNQQPGQDEQAFRM